MVTRDEELKWAYLLDPCFELTNSAGKPLTDGYLEVYIAGTRNKYYCASDFAGTLHPFQIPLDSLGSNIVLADPDNAYDVYVYNRFGSLVMSRYNVTPADGGAVISNTERINELEELVVSAVTGLQGQIDDINEALDGKKDKQEEYTVTLTPSQTVSAIIQDENGQLQVITQEIALPDSVPNVNIVSPASTLTVSSVYDPVTNTNTFNIDISDTGTLEYGQYMNTSDITTGAVLTRIKGNLNTTLDGKIKLAGGKSYHITVRGTYSTGNPENTVEPLQYVEYVSNSRIKVDVDNTVTEDQHFELSYDLFKLAADTDYYVSFLPSSGKVTELTVEVHSLSSISTSSQGGGGSYEQGWGIIIDNDTISVDPSILDQYTTTEEVTEIVSSVSTVLQDEIDNIQQGVQSDWEQDDPSEPDYIKNKPDLDIYATNEMVTSVSSTLVEMVDEVSGNIPELPDTEAVEFEELDVDSLATKDDISEFVTSTEMIETVSSVSSVLQDEIDNIHITEYQAGEYISIENETISVTGLQPEGDYATREELVTAVSAVSANIPELPEEEEVEFQEINLDDYALASAIPDLSGYAETTEVIDMVSAVSTVLQNEIDNIPEQVQSDWTEEDSEDPAYILHKPEVKDVYAGPNIILTDTASGLEISALGTTDTDTVSAIAKAYADAVSAAIPEAQVQSDWTQDDDTKKDYIKNKPTPKTLVAGQNIVITDTVTGLEISSTGGGGGGGTTYTAGTGIDITNDVISVNSDVALASAIPELPDEEEVDFEEIDLDNYALASAVPDVSNLATKTELATVEAEIPTLPEEVNLVAGQNISIAVTGASAVISSTGGGSSSSYTPGTGIDITNDVISVNADVALASAVPDVSNLATKTELATVEAEVQTVSAAIPELPDEEEVDFEELDLTDYALASAVPTIELDDNDQVTAIDGHALACGGGGTTYTAGDYIDITDDTISVTGLDNSNIFWATYDVTTHADVLAAYNAGKRIFLIYGSYIVPLSGKDSYDYFTFIYFTNVGGRNGPYVYRITLNQNSGWGYYSGSMQGDWNQTNQYSPDYIKNKPDLSTYATVASVTAVADSIPEIELNGNDQVTAIDGHELAGGGGTQVQSNWTEDDTSDPSYIQNKPEEQMLIAGNNVEITIDGASAIISAQGGGVTYSAGTGIDITNDVISVNANVALASAIPDTSDMATETWVEQQGYLTSVPSTYVTDTELNSAVSGLATKTEVNSKQNTLTGITDVQVVQALPASPVSTVLYLIPEA